MRVDVLLPTTVYLWFELLPNGEDLYLDTSADTSVGSAPEWMEYDFDLDIIIDPQWRREESGLGWIFTRTWHEWGLREGIAPWQPFLLKVCEPVYDKIWTDCGYEYDVEWDWDIVEVQALPPDQVLRRWVTWHRWRDRYERRMKAAMQAFKELRYGDLSAMYLNTFHYWTRSGHSDCPPDGVGVRLCSNHTQIPGYMKGSWADMAEGRDNGGDRNVAFARLAPQALQINPVLTEAKLRELPQHWGG